MEEKHWVLWKYVIRKTSQRLKEGITVQVTFRLKSKGEYALTKQRAEDEKKSIWLIKIFHILKQCIYINFICCRSY